MASRTTLFIANLSADTRAKDVAREFERYGQLVRCDIPTPNGRSRGYAFIEFVEERDASAAYDDMRGRRIDGREISVQWAKRAPSSGWRQGDRDGRDRSPRGGRGRSRSPPRGGRGRSPPRGGRSPRRSPRGDRSPPRRDRSPPRRERSPPRRERSPRKRSPSPGGAPRSPR